MRRRYSRSPIPTIFAPKQSEATASSVDNQFKIGPLTLPFRLRYFIILPLIYFLSGVFLDGLWRGVDANTFSVLLGMRGDLYFQGEVFRQSVSTAPAYYRLLDFGTQILGHLFSAPTAMRLSHAAILLSGVFALYRALRIAFAAEIATISVLVTITCLGGLEFMHVVGAKAGVFLAISISLWGIAQSFSRSYGGVIMGMGFVLSIMMGSGTLIPTLTPALIVMASKRGREHPVFRIAMLLAISMMGVTLISLFMFTGRAATELGLWLPNFAIYNIEDFVKALTRQVWFTFPLWTTLFAFRLYTRKQWSSGAQSLMLLGIAGFILALPLSLSGADGSMTLLPFLALLFAPSLLLIGNHWLRAWHWFNFLFFTIFLLPLILIRLFWFWGTVPLLNDFFKAEAPNFDSSISWWSIIASVIIVLLWFYWTVAAKRHLTWSLRPALGWVLGMVALAGIVAILWLPAIDYGKSYKSMVKLVSERSQSAKQAGKLAAPCVDVALAPFAFQVNWSYLTKQSVANQSHCDFRLITLGKSERQSLLLSDELLRKEEALIESEVAETSNKAFPEWISLEVFQRPGETREVTVLQQRHPLFKNHN